MQMKWLALTIGALVSAAAVAAETVEHIVDQKDLQFSEETITLNVGEAIRFTNKDRTPHNILIMEDAMFHDSGLQKPGDDAVITFDTAGTFNAMCGIHPKMALKVEVVDE